MMQSYLDIEEFPGCCAFSMLLDFPPTATKKSIEQLKIRVSGLEEDFCGGVWCTLNNHQVTVWDEHLKALGFQCLSSGLMNPITGNTISTYLLDFKADPPEPEEDEYYP